MPEDVDAVAVDRLGDDLERALEYSLLQRGVAEALAFLERLDPPFHEGARVVVADPPTVDVDLMDRADEVVERLARVRTERRRDSKVVLEAHAEAEPRRVLDVALYRVLVRKLVPPRVVVRDAVRPCGNALRAVGERDGAVRAVAVDVVIEERAHTSSGCPAQAASTIVQRTPETSVCPPSSRGNGASRAASVNSRRGFAWMRSAMKRYEANRSAAPGRQPRCAQRTSVANSIPSQSSCIRAKNSRGPIFS